MITEQANYHAAYQLIDFLHSLNCSQICIAPGYRNSPINLAAEGFKKLKTFRYIDERSLAFFCLGLIKQSKRPAAIVCTSGTAAANFFPAILEAENDRIPLVVITADRPRTLYNSGSNQTTNQENLYGKHVTKSINLDSRENITETLKSIFIQTKTSLQQGPIHINISFYEPLIPSIFPKWVPENIKYQSRAKALNLSTKNKKNIVGLKQLSKSKSNNTLIFVGSKTLESTEICLINDTASNLNALIIAEPSSGYFNQPNVSELALRYPEQILNELLSVINENEIASTTIVRFFKPPTNKAYIQIESNAGAVVTINSGFSKVPSLRDAVTIETNDSDFSAIKEIFHDWTKNDDHFNKKIKKIEEGVSLIFDKYLNYQSTQPKLSDISALKIIYESLADHSNILIGNSMVIRDFNLSCLHSFQFKNIKCYTNRGLSGIDGLVATGLGIASATNAETTIIIGDISFLYDVNSLAMINHLPNKKIRIVVINNNGGDIFRQVTTKNFDESWFVTPQSFSIEKIAIAFGWNFLKANNFGELTSIFNKAIHPVVIEAITNQDYNKLHRESLSNSLK